MIEPVPLCAPLAEVSPPAPAGGATIRDGAIGARMTIRIDDDAPIPVARGGRLDPSDPATGITARPFGTGGERHAWPNRIRATGRRRLSPNAGAARIAREFPTPR